MRHSAGWHEAPRGGSWQLHPCPVLPPCLPRPCGSHLPASTSPAAPTAQIGDHFSQFGVVMDVVLIKDFGPLINFCREATALEKGRQVADKRMAKHKASRWRAPRPARFCALHQCSALRRYNALHLCSAMRRCSALRRHIALPAAVKALPAAREPAS